jgi:hypothetical protein
VTGREGAIRCSAVHNVPHEPLGYLFVEVERLQFRTVHRVGDEIEFELHTPTLPLNAGAYGTLISLYALIARRSEIHGILVGLDLIWQFMIQPELCDEYNEAVEAVLAEEFNKADD